MAEANLPEEIIVNIISRLPVKSLLRFTAVSKRWRSIIMFDKQFENELRRNKTLSRSLLLCSWPPQLESLDLETTSWLCGTTGLLQWSEYGVSESWTKLFSLRFSNPERLWTLRAFLITENYTVARIFSGTSSTIIRISHKQEEGEEEPSFDLFPDAHWSGVIECEDSLVSVGGYNGFGNPSHCRTKLNRKRNVRSLHTSAG